MLTLPSLTSASETMRKKDFKAFTKLSFDNGSSVELNGEWRLHELLAAIVFMEHCRRTFFGVTDDDYVEPYKVTVDGAKALMRNRRDGRLNAVARDDGGQVWLSWRWHLDSIRDLCVVLENAVNEYQSGILNGDESWKHANGVNGEVLCLTS